MEKYRVVGSDKANRCYRVEIIAAADERDARDEFRRRWPHGFIDSANLLAADVARGLCDENGN
jgi:hypothetical protein